jgi:hypothetical protein
MSNREKYPPVLQGFPDARRCPRLRLLAGLVFEAGLGRLDLAVEGQQKAKTASLGLRHHVNPNRFHRLIRLY